MDYSIVKTSPEQQEREARERLREMAIARALAYGNATSGAEVVEIVETPELEPPLVVKSRSAATRAVVLTAEQGLEPQRAERPLERLDRGGELAFPIRIVGAAQQLIKRERVVQRPLEVVDAVELRVQAREFGRDPPALRGVVPERGIRRLLLEVGGLRALGLEVKGTPVRPAGRRRSPRGVPCTRSSRESTDRGRDGPHGATGPFALGPYAGQRHGGDRA